MTTVRRVSFDDAAVAPLIASLAEEYVARYGPTEEMMRTAAGDFEPPDGLFLVVVDDDGGTIAGGGFLRHGSDACEIKRMWTSARHRRQGLAATVLATLEEAARAAGYRRVVLETGPAQPEAHALYRSRGYREVPVFGPYARATAYEKAIT